MLLTVCFLTSIIAMALANSSVPNIKYLPGHEESEGAPLEIPEPPKFSLGDLLIRPITNKLGTLFAQVAHPNFGGLFAGPQALWEKFQKNKVEPPHKAPPVDYPFAFRALNP